jgi:hypothetical protein
MYIQLQNESGERIKVWEGHIGQIYGEALELEEKNNQYFPWITSIDPYGDTTYNYLQIRHVTKELEQLSERLQDEDMKNQIKSLISFLSDVNGQVTEQDILYARVVGD